MEITHGENQNGRRQDYMLSVTIVMNYFGKEGVNTVKRKDTSVRGLAIPNIGRSLCSPTNIKVGREDVALLIRH